MRARRALLASLCVAFAATPAHAQVLRGRVVDERDGAALADVTVRVRSTAGELPAAISDSAGRFQVVLPGTGTYALHASRIGYAEAGPLSLSARRGEIVDVVVRLGTAAIALAPLEVTARTSARSTLQDVDRRIDQVRRSGIGRAMTRDEIDRRAPGAAATLVNSLSPRLAGTEGIRDENTIILHSGAAHGDCYPAVYVDGFRINQGAPGNVNRYLAPQDIEAVEVYIGQGEMPMQYRDPANCGVVLFWSRRGPSQDARGLTWKRAAVGAAAIAAILLFAR